MLAMVVPSGMPAPLTAAPTTNLAVEPTVTVALPLTVAEVMASRPVVKIVLDPVTAADKAKCLESKIAVTVVPVGMPVPVTTVPTDKPAVDPTITTELPTATLEVRVPVVMADMLPRLSEVAVMSPFSVNTPVPTLSVGVLPPVFWKSSAASV